MFRIQAPKGPFFILKGRKICETCLESTIKNSTPFECFPYFFRAQTGNYGQWDNAALPNTFGAQLYDLADPWGNSGTTDGNRLNPAGNETACCIDFQDCQHPAHNWTCTAAQNATNAACNQRGQKGLCGDYNFCANPDPSTGKFGPLCAPWNASLWWGTLQQVEALVRKNAPSGIVANNFMGGIHPRLKRPAGRRLAHAAIQLVPRYRALAGSSGGDAKTGPTLAGCALNANGTDLLLHFNRSLLGSEALLLRPFDADMANWAWRYDSSHKRLNKTDSLALMVCTTSLDPEQPGNETTCQCSSWDTLQMNSKKAFRCDATAFLRPHLVVLRIVLSSKRVFLW